MHDSKPLERAIYHQMISHLDFNEYIILQHTKHGFCRNKSTSTAIMDLTKMLLENYNNDLHTSCVFINYKKASETLDHKLLLYRLD